MKTAITALGLVALAVSLVASQGVAQGTRQGGAGGQGGGGGGRGGRGMPVPVPGTATTTAPLGAPFFPCGNDASLAMSTAVSWQTIALAADRRFYMPCPGGSHDEKHW